MQYCFLLMALGCSMYRIYFLLLVFIFNVNLITAETFPLFADDLYISYGDKTQFDAVAISDLGTYDSYIFSTYDGYSWTAAETGFTQPVQNGVYWFNFVSLNLDTPNVRISELTIYCSTGCTPLVRRIYYDDGTLLDNVYGVDSYFDRYVTPQYAKLANLESGFIGTAAGAPIDAALPIESSIASCQAIPKNNILNSSFNDWSCWITTTMYRPFVDPAVDVSTLVQIVPWVLTISFFFNTISPVIPVYQFLAYTTLLFVLWNLTLILAIYDRIRKLLI